MTLRLNGSTSGYTEIDAPAVAGSNTLVLPTGAGSAYQVVRNGATAGSLEFTDKIVSGTAQNSTSGTSIDFTGIPSWVKRVTVMFAGVSTNGTSFLRVQLGSGSPTTSGYLGYASAVTGGQAVGGANLTSGFDVQVYAPAATAATLYSGSYIFTLLASNTWTANGSIGMQGNQSLGIISGSIPLSGTLDRVRITTVNGTDTFDAGSINIMYE